jgi:hypothetical protein
LYLVSVFQQLQNLGFHGRSAFCRETAFTLLNRIARLFGLFEAGLGTILVESNCL